MSVLIMAGHENIRQIEIPHLRGSTGAPGEVQFTVSCAEQLVAALRERGIEAEHTDAIYHAPIYSRPWQLFLTLHYDSFTAGKARGCRFARGVRDFVGEESDRLVGILVDQYPSLAGIPLYPGNQVTPGMAYHYAFDYPRKEVPAVIVECGVGHHPLDRPRLVLDDGRKANPQIALALAECIAVFLGGEVVAPRPEPSIAIGPSNYQKMLNRQAVNERLIQLYQEPVRTVMDEREFEEIRRQYFDIINDRADTYDLEKARAARG